MKFAGKDFIYLSKKKIDKINSFNPKNNIQNLDAPPILIPPPIKDESKISNKLQNDLDKMEMEEDNKNSNDSNSCCNVSNEHLNDRYSAGSYEDNLSCELMDDDKPNINENEIENYSKETDINILGIEYNQILEKEFSLNEKPIKCDKCNAILNMFSNINLIENDKYKWECEFCKKINEIELNKDSIPLTKNIDYIIEQPKEIETPKIGEKKSNLDDDTSLIFCFDISGSMSQSYNVSKEVYDKIKGNLNKKKFKYQKLDSGSESENEDDRFNDYYYRNMNSVNRLETLQAAISSNIKKIAKDSPNIKVGLVTFNSNVTIYGDCLSKKININEKDDKEKIKKLGEEYSNLILNPISKTSNKILSVLNRINENGCTALGPGIVLSLSLLKNAKKGSRIFLCTDGLANEGIGKIEEENEKEFEKTKEFYENIGNEALEKGISINLITFKDQHSGIEILMKMVEKSGGEIMRVTPEQIVEDFSDMLESNTIGMNAILEIKLHNLLMFRNENKEVLSNDDSNYKKLIGNIRSDMIDYFEFKFKKAKLISDMNININQIKKIPIQCIIEYTDKNNGKYIKVFTDLKTVSSNKEEILKQADFDVVSGNAIQKSAKMAMEGRFKDAQINNMAWKKFLNENQSTNKNSHENYSRFKANMNNFNQNLVFAQSNNNNNNFNNSNRINDRLSAQIYNLNNNQNQIMRKLKRK